MFSRKQAESFPGRDFYLCRGVDWPRFILWLLLPFTAAALLAIGMFALFNYGEYYVLILPLLTAVAVGGLMLLAVNKGHCRSPMVAGILGAAAGLLLYLGYYYCGMIYQVGPDTAARPDLLPYYIRARMESDVIRDTNTDQNDEAATRKSKGDPWFNWVTFALELGLTVAITGGIGLMKARKPYCNACHKWMLREVTLFEPNQSSGILDALRTGSARSLAALCAKPVFATIPNTTLAIEFCPTLKDGVSRDCPIYASLKTVTKVGRSPTRDPFDAPNGKLLLRSLKLNPDEIAALGSRFKIFESVAGRAAVAALQPEVPASSANAPTGPVADIKPVEPDYAGKVLTKRNAAVATALIFAGLLSLFGGLGIMLWGGMTAFPDKNSPQDVPPAKKAAGIALLTLGGLTFAGTALFFLINPTYLGNRFILRKVREEFSRRPKCLVDPNDPDALFVEIVPKLNWGRMTLETASDLGFLKLDPRRKEILFEGDKERFRIPAEAITYCAVEFFIEGQGSHAATKIYFVVLRANRPNDFWEAPIRERLGGGKFRSRLRKKSAERLLQSINDMRGPSREPIDTRGLGVA
jgi:hypothetical protein